ncbi:MAG: YhjD/YihY/BrkB family envelope integrity protein [Mycobacteriales bacterium]
MTGRQLPTLHEARQRLEEQRSRKPLVDNALRSIQIFGDAGGGLLAGAIAFRFFLFLVPCVFVLVMGLGLGADAAGADVQDVARRAGIAGVAATAITSSADASTVTQWVTLGVAFVALLTGARNLVKALWVAHALLWRVPAGKPRHPMRTGLMLIGGFLAASLLLRVANGIRSISLVGWVLALALYTLVPAALWLACSARLFPRRPGVTWRHVLPGAVVFGLGVQALHLVTVFWVARSIESKSEAYGAIGAALTILLWAYLMGLLVTGAAALNAATWQSRRPPEGRGSDGSRDAPLRSGAAR